jgi:hypothetical protein
LLPFSSRSCSCGFTAARLVAHIPVAYRHKTAGHRPRRCA